MIFFYVLKWTYKVTNVFAGKKKKNAKISKVNSQKKWEGDGVHRTAD